MILYSDRDGLASHRVRFVLAEKGIDADLQFVDADVIPEDLLQLNPYHSLPTLVDRELVLYGQSVISEYLDERYPHPAMMPADPVSRARSRLALYRMQKDWYSLLPGLTDAQAATVKRTRKTLQESLTAASEIFNLKAFFLHDEFSLLDASLAPFLWRLPGLGIELPAAAAAIREYEQRVFNRSAFIASMTAQESELR